MPPRGQGIGFSLLTRITVAPTDIKGFIPTDFYSRVWVRVRVSSCGFFGSGFLFMDSYRVFKKVVHLSWGQFHKGIKNEELVKLLRIKIEAIDFYFELIVYICIFSINH